MFTDRKEAGALLARALESHPRVSAVIGLARGGVAISSVIAKHLGIPQYVLVVKKIGSPGNPELAAGARVPDGQSLDIGNKTVIIADDGAATGATMEAAVVWVRKHGARKVIVALPVAPPDVALTLRTRADDVVVLETPEYFGAVGQFYRNFPQLTDKDVIELLR